MLTLAHGAGGRVDSREFYAFCSHFCLNIGAISIHRHYIRKIDELTLFEMGETSVPDDLGGFPHRLPALFVYLR